MSIFGESPVRIHRREKSVLTDCGRGVSSQKVERSSSIMTTVTILSFQLKVGLLILTTDIGMMGHHDMIRI